MMLSNFYFLCFLYVSFSYDMTIDFNLIFDSFLNVWASNGLLLRSLYDSNTVLRYSHVLEQFSLSMILSFLNLEFDLIPESFLNF